MFLTLVDLRNLRTCGLQKYDSFTGVLIFNRRVLQGSPKMMENKINLFPFLVKYILSFSSSQVNTVGERGFSVNKKLISSHVSTVYAETLEVHCFGKTSLYEIDLLSLK